MAEEEDAILVNCCVMLGDHQQDLTRDSDMESNANINHSRIYTAFRG